MNPQALKKLTGRAALLEAHLAELEAAVRTCQERLAVFVSADETARLTAELERVRAEITGAEAEWTELQDAIAANL
jgi:predicted  nucleic acid-binding Zn-ribbon protein